MLAMVMCRQQCIKIHWDFYLHLVNKIHSLLKFFFPKTSWFVNWNCVSIFRACCNFRCLCCLFHRLVYYYMFLLFIQFMGLSQQVYWGSLPFPFPVDHILSELSTMSHPSWVRCMASFIASLNYTSLFAMTRQRFMKGRDRETWCAAI